MMMCWMTTVQTSKMMTIQIAVVMKVMYWGSDVSVYTDNDPGEEFGEMELSTYDDLYWINCHDKAETRTPILTLREPGSYANNFLFLSHFKYIQQNSPTFMLGPVQFSSEVLLMWLAALVLEANQGLFCVVTTLPAQFQDKNKNGN